MAKKEKDSGKIFHRPVDPVLRIPNVAVDKQHLVERAVTRFHQFSLDRIEWMRRREQFYLGWDDYLSPSRKGLWEGSSNLHLPLTEIQVTVMHALIMQAVLFNYPWFYIDPQEDVDVERVKKAERFMKYVLERYCNFNKGIYNAIDDWAMDFVTEGMAVLSRQWKTVCRRFMTVEENPAFKQQRLDLQSMLEDTEEDRFDELAKKLIKQPFVEKSIIRTVFDGPVVIAEDPAFILFKGDVVDCTDLNEHETVQKVCYFSDSDVKAFGDSEYWDEEAVEKVLESTPDRRWASDTIWGNDRTRRAKDIQGGVNTINPFAQERMYEFLCVYDHISASSRDKGASADRLQYFVHPKTRQLMRWTYLDRISSNGKLPLHMGHLFRRPRRAYGRGMVQTMFALNETSDILVNQAIDAGMLANNPMFAFRGNSTLDPGEVRAEPGIGIKTDDPNNDLRFFDFKVNTQWSEPIQGMINQYASQLTSIGPQSSGQVGPNVGALRSTSGVQAMQSLALPQQNVLINRAKNCISECFEGLYSDCVDKMPAKMKISVTGAEGIPMFDDDGAAITEEVSQEDLRMRLHFGIYANAINMNHESQKNAAMAIAQFSFQPLAVQTGIVGPQQVYEILANIHQTQGTLRPERFIQKPANYQPVGIEWELRMIMAGQMPPIQLNDPDHAGKIEVMVPLLESPEAQKEAQYGKIAPNALAILKQCIQLHQRYLETAQKPSNVENPTGNNQSQTAGQQSGQPQGQPQQGSPKQPKNRQPQPEEGQAPQGQAPGGQNG